MARFLAHLCTVRNLAILSQDYTIIKYSIFSVLHRNSLQQPDQGRVDQGGRREGGQREGGEEEGGGERTEEGREERGPGRRS